MNVPTAPARCVCSAMIRKMPTASSTIEAMSLRTFLVFGSSGAFVSFFEEAAVLPLPDFAVLFLAEALFAVLFAPVFLFLLPGGLPGPRFCSAILLLFYSQAINSP